MLAFSLLLFVLSGFFIKDLVIESTLLDTKGMRSDTLALFLRNLERFGESAPAVLLQRHGGVEPSVRNRFTRTLARRLLEEDEILGVQTGVFDLHDRQKMVHLLRAAVFRAPDLYLPGLLKTFLPPGIRRATIRTRKRLVLMDNPEIRELIALDVFNLRSLIAQPFQRDMGNFKIARDTGYFDSPDHSMRLLFAQPRGSGEDNWYCRRITRRIRRIVNDVRQSDAAFAGITCGFAGKYGFTAESMEMYNREMLRINLLSALLIFILILVVFRNITAALMCSLPIALSLCIALLVARFFFNPLKMVSLGFAAVILGLGVDIAFHLSSRFFQYHQKQGALESAIRKTMENCTVPLVIGFSTTSFGFLILAVSDYAALRQFGILTALGLMLTLVTTLFLFPALARVLRPDPVSGGGVMRLGFFSRILYMFSLRRPRLIRAAAFVVIAISTLAAFQLRFDMELFKLLPQNLSTVRNARQVSSAFGTSFFLNTQVTLETRDITKGMAYQRELDQRLLELVKNNRITGFYSPTLFYIPREAVRANLHRVRELYRRIIAGRATMFAELTRFGVTILPRHGEYYDLLETAFDPVAVADEQDTEQEERFILRKDGTYFLQTYIWPRHEWDRPERLLAVPRELDDFPGIPGVRKSITGTYLVHQAVNKTIKKEFTAISLWAVGGIAVILLLFFGFRREWILSLLPLMITVPLTLAFVTLAGITFSPSLIGIVAIIIGIGIDDAVHLIQRRQDEPGRPLASILGEIAPVLTLTTVSTVLCFMTLVVSSSPITSDIGIIVGFGIMACWLCTVLFLPAFLEKYR